jgi:hypothetical protein
LYEFEGCSGDGTLNRLAGDASARGLASRRRCLAWRSVEQPSRVLVVDRGAASRGVLPVSAAIATAMRCEA